MHRDKLRVLWAKKPLSPADYKWLPLLVHMEDVAETARRLWDEWLPHGLRKMIVAGITLEGTSAGEALAYLLFVFLAGAHDTGKASPVFQAKKQRFASLFAETDEMLRRLLLDAGYPPLRDNYRDAPKTRHELVSHAILKRNGFDESVCVIVGGHHGTPPNTSQLNGLRKSLKSNCGFDNAVWINAQDALVRHAIQYAGPDGDILFSLKVSRPVQVLLCGLVILCDWISSDTALFPLIDINRFNADSKKRAEEAFEKLRLPNPWNPEQDWDELYQRRFGIERERPVQAALLEAAQQCHRPGIFVVEAPMGEGKTEAALAAAEVLAYRNKSGRRGIYFALPSQATSNAIFSRVLNWIKNFDTLETTYSVRLSHGKANLYEEDILRLSGQVNIGEENQVTVHEWLSGRKKGMLSDFTVGTIDHVLMAGLKQKHLMLRHLGLSAKVVVIDECHAYDTYMNSYLLLALKWLGAYGVPVIILSATLPASRRYEVINAYLNGKKPLPIGERPPWASSLAYPLITYTDGGEARQVEVRGASRPHTVTVRISDEASIIGILEQAIEGGGYAGVIVNTVARAQEIYRRLADYFGEDITALLHARFIAADRAEREDELLSRLGPSNRDRRSGKLIVIGTQVLEQSLDLDFDIMITELCPMDLLLQRIGRLHRHDRERPERLISAVCYVIGTSETDWERGAEMIYGKYLLLRTRAFLPEAVNLPEDIPELVEKVYGGGESHLLEIDSTDVFIQAKEKWESGEKIRRSKATSYQLSEPVCQDPTIVGWLENSLADGSEKRGEAAVRDGEDSVEVIVIQRRGGKLYLLPWVKGSQEIPVGAVDEALAKKIMSCSVRLPAFFSSKWMIDNVIKELEDTLQSEGLLDDWYSSHWLKGSLVLILNEDFEVTLCNAILKYDKLLGLVNVPKNEGV